MATTDGNAVHGGTSVQDGTPEAPTTITSSPSFSFSKEDFLKFVELDLWGRFQDRLWKLVGAFLTVTTIAGLFGVPYYIKSEVGDRLRKDEVDFTSRRDAILAQSKAVVIMNVAYETQLLNFYAEVEHVDFSIRNLPSPTMSGGKRSGDSSKNTNVNDFALQQASTSLRGLLTKREFTDTLASVQHLSFAWPILTPEMKKLKISEGRIITMSMVSGTGAAGSSFTDPVYDGTLGGAFNDLVFRMITIESLRRTIQKMDSDLTSYGGETDSEKRAEAARVDGLLSTAYSNSFQEQLTKLSSSSLDDSQQKLYKSAKEYYLPNILQVSEQPNLSGVAQ